MDSKSQRAPINLKANFEFLDAVNALNFEKVNEFLSQSLVDVNYQYSDRNTALYYAACLGSVEMCRLLLEYGANPKFATSLMYAYHNGNDQEAKAILRYEFPKLDIMIDGKCSSLMMLVLESYSHDASRQELRLAIFDEYVRQFKISSIQAANTLRDKYLQYLPMNLYSMTARELTDRFHDLLKSYIASLQTKARGFKEDEYYKQSLFIDCRCAAQLTFDGKSLLMLELMREDACAERVSFLLSAGANVTIKDADGLSVLSEVMRGRIKCSDEIMQCLLHPLLEGLAQTTTDENLNENIRWVLDLTRLTGRSYLANYIAELINAEAPAPVMTGMLMLALKFDFDAHLSEMIFDKIIVQISSANDVKELAYLTGLLAEIPSPLILDLVIKLMEAGMDPASITAAIPKEYAAYGERIKQKIVNSIMTVDAATDRLEFAELLLFDNTFPLHCVLATQRNTMGPKKLVECNLDKGSFKQVKIIFEAELLRDRQLFLTLKPATQAYYMRKLLAAIDENNCDEIARLHQLGVNLNMACVDEHVPLIHALLSGKLDAAKALIVLEAEIKCQAVINRRALLAAAKRIGKKPLRLCEEWLLTQVGAEFSISASKLAELVGNDFIVRAFKERAQVLDVQSNPVASVNEVSPPSYQQSQAERLEAGMPPSYAEVMAMSRSYYTIRFFSQPLNSAADIDVPPPTYIEATTSMSAHSPARFFTESRALYPWELVNESRIRLQQLVEPLVMMPAPSAPTESDTLPSVTWPSTAEDEEKKQNTSLRVAILK